MVCIRLRQYDADDGVRRTARSYSATACATPRPHGYVSP